MTRFSFIQESIDRFNMYSASVRETARSGIGENGLLLFASCSSFCMKNADSSTEAVGSEFGKLDKTRQVCLP
jgi:hypothetical protein